VCFCEGDQKIKFRTINVACILPEAAIFWKLDAFHHISGVFGFVSKEADIWEGHVGVTGVKNAFLQVIIKHLKNLRGVLHER